MRILWAALLVMSAGCGTTQKRGREAIVVQPLEMRCAQGATVKLWPDGDITVEGRHTILGRIVDDELVVIDPFQVRCTLDASGRLVQEGGRDCFDGLLQHWDDPPLEVTVDTTAHTIRTPEALIGRIDGLKAELKSNIAGGVCTFEGYRADADRAAMLLFALWAAIVLRDSLARM